MAICTLTSFSDMCFIEEDSCKNPDGFFSTIIGSDFTVNSEDPTVSIDSEDIEVFSFTDTEIVVIMPEGLDIGVHLLEVDNGDPETCSINFFAALRSLEEATVCFVKTDMNLVFDEDGPLGNFGRIMTVIENSSMVYLQVRLKYNLDFDFTTGGEVTLDDVELLDGDLVYLSNQAVSSENGIYIVRTGTWDFDQVVDSDLFVDLGARAIDSIDGDLTRDIITFFPDLDFSTTGFYSINYLVVNSQGSCQSLIRKVRVLPNNDASLVPVDTFKITQYDICAALDKDIAGNDTIECE